MHAAARRAGARAQIRAFRCEVGRRGSEAAPTAPGGGRHWRPPHRGPAARGPMQHAGAWAASRHCNFHGAAPGARPGRSDAKTEGPYARRARPTDRARKSLYQHCSRLGGRAAAPRPPKDPRLRIPLPPALGCPKRRRRYRPRRWPLIRSRPRPPNCWPAPFGPLLALPRGRGRAASRSGRRRRRRPRSAGWAACRAAVLPVCT